MRWKIWIKKKKNKRNWIKKSWGIARTELKALVAQVPWFVWCNLFCVSHKNVAFISKVQVWWSAFEKQLHYQWQFIIESHWHIIVIKFKILYIREKSSKAFENIQLEREVALNLMECPTLPQEPTSRSRADLRLAGLTLGTYKIWSCSGRS